MSAATLLGVKNFRGVYMRDALPTSPRKNETAIVNLDSARNAGTHWVCYRKTGAKVDYFDSYGNLRPPAELVGYLKRAADGPIAIRYNYERKQGFDSVVCGHLCLEFLSGKDVVPKR